jgi:hypothetical protein
MKMKTKHYGATIKNIRLSTDDDGKTLKVLVSSDNGRGLYAHLDEKDVLALIGALVNFQRMDFEQGARISHAHTRATGERRR